MPELTSTAQTDPVADEPEYRGAATLHADGIEIAVQAHLRGTFQPIDGRFHWYGRLAAGEEVDAFAAQHRKNVLIRTDEGEATGTLSDRDTWGRFRIDGTGRPPYRIDDAAPSED